VTTKINVPHTPSPPLDCFYVYPTVSQEKRRNADLNIQTAEKAAVIPQAARFSQVCRVFAPVYRQTTGRPGGSNELAYGDVLAAWRDYLAHDNDGRGVVLIGHSEGAFMLEQLLREQGASIRKVLVSALLLGGDVQVGADEKFAGFPACRTSSAAGCIVGNRPGAARPRRARGSRRWQARRSTSSASTRPTRPTAAERLRSRRFSRGSCRRGSCPG
jgi:pimeloyl-ACP methyl ester carboxylesterase